MNDLQTRLAALRAPAGVPDDDAVAADLRRGRRALGRRRAVRMASTGVLALAVGGVAIATVASPNEPDVSGVHLVDYNGDQVSGFTVAKVPEGFVLQGSHASVLDVSRPGDHSDLDDFQDKIVVTVESTRPAEAPARVPSVRIRRDGDTLVLSCPDGTTKRLQAPKNPEKAVNAAVRRGCGVSASTQQTPGSDAPGTVGHTIDVDGSAGRITTNGEGTKTFRFVDGDFRVVIQAWPSLGLSDAQLAEFADGVTVNAEAQFSHG